jgi:hypothetical protein
MSDSNPDWLDSFTANEAHAMIQGVGSRFDFRVKKTLCDLRTREVWVIIIDFPHSTGTLQDLLVRLLTNALLCPRPLSRVRNISQPPSLTSDQFCHLVIVNVSSTQAPTQNSYVATIK